MNIKEVNRIKDLFEKNPSALVKKGAEFLANKWNTDVETIRFVKDCLNSPSSDDLLSFEQATNKIRDMKIHPSSLQIKSAWQNAKGEMQYSYKVDTKAFQYSAILDAVQNIKPKPITPKKKVSKHLQSSVLEISLADLHLGKRSSVETSFDILEKVRDMVSKAISITPLSRIVIVNLGDFFNSDGNRNSTTKGTPQNTVDNYKVMFETGVNLLVSIIDYCSEIAPVDFVNIQGNHDWNTAYYLGQTIKTYYRNDTNVTCHVNSGRVALNYGPVSVMYDHGEIKKDYALLFATEFPKEWSLSNYREIHLGHFHSETTKDEKGCVVRHLISGTRHDDEWHYMNGYIGNKVGLQGFLYGSKLEAILYE